MYNTLVYQPILSGLIFLYKLLGNNLGLAIIVLTLVIRVVLIPLTLPSMKSAKKIAGLKPELDALRRKYAKDQKSLQEKTLELYKKNNVNPAGGCLPYLVQIVFLIALYQVFIDALGNGSLNGTVIQTQFLLWNLKEKDTTLTLPILSGILQLLTSLAIMPGVEDDPKKRPGKKEEKEDVAEMASAMQQQMVFLMPAMTVFFALQFPSGLALYWTVTTAFSFVQQLIVSGPGGLKKYLDRLPGRRSN